MDKQPEDQPARERARTDHEGSLAVEAGAGTGKTTLLVERVLDGLQSGRFAIHEVAAITFTRKAAAELRARIRLRIEERLRQLKAAGEGSSRLGGPSGEQPKEDPGEGSGGKTTGAWHPLEEARRSLPLAQISTIHSFCRAILATHPLEAGLDPDFQVAEEGLGPEQARRLWEEWFAGVLTDPERVRPFGDLLSWGGRLEDLGTLAAAIQQWPDVVFPSQPGRRHSDEELWSYVRESLEGFGERYRAALGKEDSFTGALAALARELERVGELPADARTAWLLGCRRGGKIHLPHLSFQKGTRKGEAGMVRAECKRWRDEELPQRLRRHFSPLVARALQEMGRFHRWAIERRKEEGLVSQNDLLAFARDVLRDRADVLDRVCRRFRVLLVDEYQDTDPLQAELLRLIADHPRAPALFLVGDPKQSIYRFRYADVETYSEDVGRLEEQGRLVSITVNFRSRPELLSAINRVGAEIFDPEGWPEGQARWQELLPSPTALPAEGPSLVIAPVGEGDPGQKILAEELARLEADLLAREMAAAREELKVPYREMAVLFPVASRAHLLEEALDRFGVPYRQEKSQSFYRRAEVAELALVLAAVADPWDEALVVGTLRTRLFGLSDEGLVRHRRGGGGFVAAEAPASGAAGEPAVLAALARIAAWHRRAPEMTPPDLLEMILGETRFLLLLELVPGGERGSANVRKLLDQAATHWREGGYGLPDFVRWLRRKIEREQAREAESPAAEDEERVALLTLHGAKGLQWEVVGLYETGHGKGGGGDVALVDRHSGRLEANFGGLLQSEGFQRLSEREGEAERAERARLLYVGMTRAKQRLVVPVPRGKFVVPKSSLQGMLNGSPTWREWTEMARQGKDPAPAIVVARPYPRKGEARPGRPRPRVWPPKGDGARMEQSERMRREWITARESLLKSADGIVVVAPSSLKAGGGSGLAEGAQEQGVSPGAAGDRGRAVGLAVHRALEWWLDGFGNSEQDPVGERGEMEVFVRRAAQLEGLGEADTSRVAKLCEAAAESPLLGRARGAGRRWCELPLVWSAEPAALPARTRRLLNHSLEGTGRGPVRPEQSIVIEGVIDLLFEDGRGRTLVDYKTDPWQSPEQLDRLHRLYSPQLELYAATLAAAGTSVDEALLLFLGGPTVEACAVELP